MPQTIENILIVDPDSTSRDALELSLLRLGLDTITANNYSQAVEALSQSPQLCLTEMQLPDASGLDLIKHIQQQSLAIPIAVISDDSKVKSVFSAIKAGAIDYSD